MRHASPIIFRKRDAPLCAEYSADGMVIKLKKISQIYSDYGGYVSCAQMDFSMTSGPTIGVIALPLGRRTLDVAGPL